MWCKDLTHWERSWCWERLKAGGKEDNRGCDSWMASPNQQTWVWASSRSWWWTGKPGILQSMGSQGVGNDWVTQLNCELYLAGCWIFLFNAWIGKIPWRRAKPTLRYSCLDNPHGQRGATVWRAVQLLSWPGRLQSMGLQRVKTWLSD